MMQDLILLFIIFVMAVSGRLKMSWEDKEGDDVVEKMRPGQDLEHMRLAVSFVNHELSFVCQAEAAQEGDLKFITSSEEISKSIKSLEQEQQVDTVVGLKIISKKAIINPVTESMDSGKIKCEYDQPGGEKGSVNITLSVWNMNMKTTPGVCENKNGNISVIFEESEQWSVDETNVKNRVREKIKDLDIKQNLTEVNSKNMFKITLPFKEVNSQLRQINDNITVDGSPISGSSCFADVLAQGRPDEMGGNDVKEGTADDNIGFKIGGGIAGGVVLIIIFYLVYAKMKRKAPFKSFRPLANGELEQQI